MVHSRASGCARAWLCSSPLLRLREFFVGVAAANLAIGFVALAVVHRQISHLKAAIDSDAVPVSA